MTYAEAQVLIHTARSRLDGKPLACHTRLTDRGVYFAICYHWTDVVVICRDGTIILNSGGYHTVTTKRRINQYLPEGWWLWQKDFVWYVSNSHSSLRASKTYLFRDGFRIGPRGGCNERRKK
jgi:hypothetical protein